MNPGIFYLYEYNNTQKLRNVGFLKLTRYYHSCTLQLNARGIPSAYADTLRLCAFYLENNTVGATVLAEVPCTNHIVSARLNFEECQFPGGHTLNTMDGFFLPLPNGRILAAAVPGILVDAKKLLAVFENPTAADQPSPQTETGSNAHDTEPDNGEPSSQRQDKLIPQTPDINSNEADSGSPMAIHFDEDPLPSIIDAEPGQEDIIPGTGSAAHNGDTTPPDTVNALPDGTSSASDDSSRNLADADAGQDNNNTEIPQETPKKTVRKIQRSDLSALPRHYWYLANNSFLLHGYHNYSHLLLVEEDGHYWLGVPGIYDSREARAARLFGFPQFTDSYNNELQLSDEEQNTHGTFGYWCCYLK